MKTIFFKKRFDGVNLFKTYSTDGYKIMNAITKTVHNEAIDVENSGNEYIETDELIEVAEEETSVDAETIEKAKAFDILVGKGESV